MNGLKSCNMIHSDPHFSSEGGGNASKIYLPTTITENEDENDIIVHTHWLVPLWFLRILVRSLFLTHGGLIPPRMSLTLTFLFYHKHIQYGQGCFFVCFFTCVFGILSYLKKSHCVIKHLKLNFWYGIFAVTTYHGPKCWFTGNSELTAMPKQHLGLI